MIRLQRSKIMNLFKSKYLKKIFQIFAVLAISIAFHYTRIFFIADESWKITREESLIKNYPLLCKWDCGFYISIANGSGASVHDQAVSAFFPLFSIVLASVHRVIPSLPLNSLSIILSNMFSVLSVALLIALGKLLWNERNEKETVCNYPRKSLLLALAVAIYPHSQFFSYGYPEPLFLSLYSSTLIFLIKRNWLLAGICSGLSAVTRPQGIWILLVFCITTLYSFFSSQQFQPDQSSNRTTRIPRKIALIPITVAILPFFIFLLWQWQTFGDPLAFLKAQSNWGRSFHFLGGLKNNIPRYDQSHILALLSIYAAFRFMRRDEIYWKLTGAMTILMGEIPLFFGGFFSYPRFSSINLGLFLMIVEITSSRFWLIVSLLIFAITRLEIEIHSWLNSSFFVF